MPNHSQTLEALEPDGLVRLRVLVLAARLGQINARERRNRYDEDLASMRMDWALERWAHITLSLTVRPGAGATT